jgi:hypothetical protein
MVQSGVHTEMEYAMRTLASASWRGNAMLLVIHAACIATSLAFACLEPS